jgi:Possible hemagglutinin (DUF637)/Pre-toxin domain with VENN motif
MNQTVFPPVLIGKSDLTPCELATKQTSWGSKFKRFFKQTITLVVLASLQLGTLVQTKEAYAQYVPYGGQPTNGQVNGQPNTGYVAPVAGALTGYTNDGTLFMGGQRIGNPHQILHDAQIPAFMTITGFRATYSNVNDPLAPNYGQGTLAQMEAQATTGSDASVLFNRVYLTPNNPYPVVPAGTHNNYQTYQNALTAAQAANYLLTNADDGKTYAFKTLTASSRQAADLLIRELPNTSQFKSYADPNGGAVLMRVSQNGDAVALSEYLKTVKPYDYSWQPNFGATFGTAFGQNGGQNPYGGWANSNNFAPDYSEGAGPAQSFQAFIKQLQDDAIKNDKRVRSQTSANSLDLSGVNPNSLFGEGYNLFSYGSNSNPNRDLENDFLRRLQAGQLTVGSADYNEASRIAQERYRIAYATRLETGKPLQYSVADAQRKANELKLDAINPNELFGQGFDLFKYNSALRANGEAENALLARLQSGELTPGSADYLQATQIAQERLRVAYSQSLVPPEPKKVSKWKLIVGAVVGAVLTFVTAGALLPYVAGALTSATVAATTAALATVSATVTTAAALATVGISASMTAVLTAVAGVVAGAVGAIASTSITTGSLSEGLKAGGKALVSGGVKAIVAGALGAGFATAGLSGLSGIEGTVSNIALNTLSGAVSSTILGQGSFADNLKTSAISSVVDAVGKSAANTIGDAFPNPNGTNVANYAAHAVLGCATAAAKGGDCAAGAVGAATGEVAAASGFLDAAAKSTIGRTLNNDEVSFFGGLVGGTAAAVASKVGDVNANFATGTATGTNAVTNNYLNHVEAKDLSDARKELAGCAKTDVSCQMVAQSKIDTLQQTSFDRDQDLKTTCQSNPSSDACKTKTAQAKAAFNSYGTDGLYSNDPTVQNEAKNARQAFQTPTQPALGAQTKADQTATGIANGAVTTAGGILAGPVLLANLGARAATGDAQAWQDLKDVAVNLAVTVTDLPAAAKRMLDAANVAEAAGDYAKAAQIRTELVGNTALIGYGAVKAAQATAEGIAVSRATNGVGEIGSGVRLYSDGSLRTPDGKFASVSGNPAPGTTASASYADFLSQNGVKVVGQEMVVNGPLGPRRYDIVVQDASGKLQGIEIKSGGATKNTYQDFTDRFVNQYGAPGAGKLAGKSVTSSITIYVP